MQLCWSVACGCTGAKHAAAPRSSVGPSRGVVSGPAGAWHVVARGAAWSRARARRRCTGAQRGTVQDGGRCMGGPWGCARGEAWGRVGVWHAALLEHVMQLPWSEARGCARAPRGAPPVRCVGQRRAQREIAQGAKHGAAQGRGMRRRWSVASSSVAAQRGTA